MGLAEKAAQSAKVGVVFWPLLMAPAVAAQPAESVSNGTLDRAFADMLRDPGNVALTFRYVELAKQAGDLEGAIGALSKLLLSDPDNFEVQRQLATLYRALGSFSTAQIYDRRALDLARTESDRKAIEDDLDDLQRVASADRLSATLQAGVAYQSNAAITAQLADFGNVQRPKSKPDENAQLGGNASYDHDFSEALADSWNSTLSFYGTQQFRLRDDNISYARLSSGPGFTLFDRRGSILHTYVLGEVMGLGDTLYLITGGAGAAWDEDLGGRFASRLEVESVKRWFNASAAYPLAAQQNGMSVLARATLGYAWPQGDHTGLRMWAADAEAQTGYARYREWGVSPAVELHFAGLWGAAAWTVTVDARYVRRPYGGPDAALSPGITRDDREWGGSIALAAPVADGWSLLAKLGQLNEDSSVLAYSYRNSQATMAVQYGF